MRRFIRFPMDALYDRRLTKTDLLTLLAICKHLNSKSDTCWPSQKAIGELALIGRQCVNRRVKHLVQTGWLKKKGRGKNGLRASCEYKVLEAAIPNAFRRGTAQKSVRGVVASAATIDDAQQATRDVASSATGKELDSKNKSSWIETRARSGMNEVSIPREVSLEQWKSARAEIRIEVGERAFQEDLAKLTWKQGTIHAPSEVIARRIWCGFSEDLLRNGIAEIYYE